MRKCRRCGEAKALEEFSIGNVSVITGERLHRHVCKACTNGVNRNVYSKRYHKTREVRARDGQRYRARKREFIRSLKDKPCADCGGTFPSYVMDFDHVRGKKVKAISQMTSCSYAEILAEAAKCDVVCANCHRIRTEESKSEIVARANVTRARLRLVRAS